MMKADGAPRRERLCCRCKIDSSCLINITRVVRERTKFEVNQIEKMHKNSQVYSRENRNYTMQFVLPLDISEQFQLSATTVVK